MRPVTWVLLGLWLGFPPGGHGDVASAPVIRVSATVLPRVRLEVDEAPVRITAADLARGHVVVTRRYTLRTNALDRVVLRLQQRLDGCVSGIAVDGLGATLRLAGAASTQVRPATRELDLAVRLRLAGGLAPGECAWPLDVAAILE